MKKIKRELIIVCCCICITALLMGTETNIIWASDTQSTIHNGENCGYRYIINVIEPTCTEAGYTEYMCSCGDIYKDDFIKAKGHQWVEEYLLEPECEENGERILCCCQCWERKYISIAARGHNWGEWKIEKNATPLVEGKKYRVCKICYEEEETIIPVRKISTSEKNAVNIVKKFLKKIKRYDFDGAERYQKGKLGYSCWKKNFIFYDISKSQFKKKFSYKITNVTTEGNIIKVTVKEIYPSAYKQTYKAMDEALEYQLRHTSISASTVVKRYTYPRIKQRIKRYGTKKKEVLVTYSLKKTAKGWKIVKMNGGKKIGMMDIYKATKDWAQQWS